MADFTGIKTHGDIPLEKAIKNLFFVYGSSANSKKLEPPPYTLRLIDASSPIAMLFERAFSESAISNNNRPKAIEWVRAFEKLLSDLLVCGQNDIHKYHKSLSKCPWCLLELVVAPFFISVSSPRIDIDTSYLDVSQLWQRILTIPSPGTAPIPNFNFNDIVGTPVPISVVFAKYKNYGLRTFAIILTAIIAVVLLINIKSFNILFLAVIYILYVMNNWAFSFKCDDGGETERRKNYFSEAKRKWDALAEQWKKEATDILFLNKIAYLKSKKNEYENLPNSYKEEIRKLETNREAIQKQHFLEKFFISKASIPGIGPNLTKILASYGIETAKDIEKNTLYNVPSFGYTRVGYLLAWKKIVEARFKFDPRKAADAADIAIIKNKFTNKQKSIEEDFAKSIGELQDIRDKILRRRIELTYNLKTAAYSLAQAKADVELI
ncbi:MAG TPA: hypothetical protein VMU29_10430 [Smithella sp.]|nr:hypothetical protein [Smithella sp.]